MACLPCRPDGPPDPLHTAVATVPWLTLAALVPKPCLNCRQHALRHLDRALPGLELPVLPRRLRRCRGHVRGRRPALFFWGKGGRANCGGMAARRHPLAPSSSPPPSHSYGNVWCKGPSPGVLYASGKCCDPLRFPNYLCPATCPDGIYGSALCGTCTPL